MTHAILDSIHHRYMEDTNPDVAAFHEGFADIVALLQRFTFGELVEHQLAASRRTDRRLYRVRRAGDAVRRSARRESRRAAQHDRASGTRTSEWVPLEASPSDYIDNVEAHDRGAVLVATVFDAFQRIYRHRTRDLLRIATSGTGVLPEGEHQPRPGPPPGARGRRDRRAPAPHLHSRARLLPAERHLVRQLPARADHGRSRHRAGRRERLPRRAHRSVPRARHFPRRVNTLSIESLLLESSGIHARSSETTSTTSPSASSRSSRRWSKPRTARSCTSDRGRRRRS